MLSQYIANTQPQLCNYHAIEKKKREIQNSGDPYVLLKTV